jgi:hypothetical protein
MKLFHLRVMTAAALAATAFVETGLAAESQETAAPAKTERIFRPTFELSIPQLLRAGVERDLDSESRFRGFAAAGLLLYPLSGSLPSVSVWGFEGGVRWHPFSESGWTFGLSGGFQQLVVDAGLSSLKVEGETIATSGSIQIRNWALKPSVAYTYRISENWEGSFEFAARIPLLSWGRLFFEDSGSGRTTENSPLLFVNSNTAMGRIASLVQPEITLFRLTYRPSQGKSAALVQQEAR